MSRKLTKTKKHALSPRKELAHDVERIIDEARAAVATTVNAGLTLLYWRIGERIHRDIMKQRRAEYGKRIVVSLARQLVQRQGPNFNEKNLRRMIQFAEVFPEQEIVVSLLRQLTWTHFIALIHLAQYLTELPAKQLLKRKLRDAIAHSSNARGNRADPASEKVAPQRSRKPVSRKDREK